MFGTAETSRWIESHFQRLAIAAIELLADAPGCDENGTAGAGEIQEPVGHTGVSRWHEANFAAASVQKFLNFFLGGRRKNR